MEHIGLIVGGVVVPSAAFASNFVLRRERRISQSAAADLVLLLIVFDFNVLLAADEFRKIMIHSELRNHIEEIHVGFLALGIFVWILSVTSLEKRIAQSFNHSTGEYNGGFPLFVWMVAWFLAVSLAASHVIAFTLKESP